MIVASFGFYYIFHGPFSVSQENGKLELFFMVEQFGILFTTADLGGVFVSFWICWNRRNWENAHVDFLPTEFSDLRVPGGLLLYISFYGILTRAIRETPDLLFIVSSPHWRSCMNKLS